MTRHLTILFLLILAAAGRAETNYCAGDWESVSNKVYDASANDTVIVSNGGWAWTAVLKITKPINLIGAGSSGGWTYITNAVPTWEAYIGNCPCIWSSPTGGVLRITGFWFDASTWINFTDPVADQGAGTSSGFRNGIYSDGQNGFVRVDHCRFSNCKWPVYFDGLKGYGLMDNCTVYDSTYLFSSLGHDYSEWALWTSPLYGIGTTNTRCAEDCFVTFTRQNVGAGMVSSGRGCSYVVRHCTWSNSFANSLTEGFDTHGNLTCDGLHRGLLWSEIYSNRVTSTSGTYRLARFRGGTVLCYSNEVNGVGVGGAIQLDEEEAWGESTISGCDTNYPREDMVTNSFFFQNYTGGSPQAISLYSSLAAISETWLANGRDYWTIDPRDYPTNAISTLPQLQYPHPLVTAQDGPATTAPVRLQLRLKLQSSYKPDGPWSDFADYLLCDLKADTRKQFFTGNLYWE